MTPGAHGSAVESLANIWQADAANYRSVAAEGAARALERAAADLRAALAAEADQLVPLERAAEISGYSPDSLRRMVRGRNLHAVRRGRRLYFRAGDLPRKPPEKALGVDAPHLVQYDPIADARMVARERQSGE
jgi:hypothetical protein